MSAKKTPAQIQREIDEVLRFAPGTRVRLTGGDNDDAVGLEGTIIDEAVALKKRPWERPAKWRRGGAWVEWDGLADPSWEKLEWLTPVKEGTL